MSIVPSAIRSIRIIAIPLTRPTLISKSAGANPPPPSSSSNGKPTRSPVLTYYHFQINSPHPPEPELSKEGPTGRIKALFTSWQPEGGVVKWATEKAADTWAGFGKAPEGSWKIKLYERGEKLVDRMEFEELALNSIDPSLGPTITRPDLAGKKSGEIQQSQVKIPLLFPPSIHSGPISLAQLSSLVAQRTPRHRKGFYVWLAIAPITAPFMIIPIIPNIPFFFCLWRSWSHYRAWRASQYLESLLETKAIVPEESVLLDAVYKTYAPAATSETAVNKSSEASPQHEVLLTREAIPAILSAFNLKPSAAADLYRGIEQARVRVNSGRAVL